MLWTVLDGISLVKTWLLLAVPFFIVAFFAFFPKRFGRS